MKRGRRLKLKNLKKDMKVIAYERDWEDEFRCIITDIDFKTNTIHLRFIDIKDQPILSYASEVLYSIKAPTPKNPSKRRISEWNT